MSEPGEVMDLDGEDPLNPSEDGNTEAESVEGQAVQSIVEALCAVCGTKPKKMRQMFGGCCEALVRAARRDAKSQGKDALAAFTRLQKLGHQQFVTALLEYKTRCFEHRGHRRPGFGIW